MSSDLLKEFGSPEENLWYRVAGQGHENKAFADEEDFGDFEDPEKEENTTPSHQTPSPPYDSVGHLVDSGYGGSKPFSVNEGHLQSSTYSSGTEVQDAPSNDDERGDFSQQSVIFDADVETLRQKGEADRTMLDRSGPKEPTNNPIHPTSNTKAFAPVSPTPAITGTNGSQASRELTKAGQQSSKEVSTRRNETTNLEPPTFDDEPWVDFEAAEATKIGRKPSNGPHSRHSPAAEVSNLGPPPSNIPPPSILLAISAIVLRSLAAELRIVPLQASLDQPSTRSQLHALLSIVRTAARILAGRKLRWKRDNLLSQSMKIGPAHSGKAGGMKLAGVDRAESRREDQEAAELLQVWKEQAGSSRRAVAALNGQLPENEHFRISEIAANTPIRQGLPREGIVTAPKCCFLCGIKRDERVAKVDVDVEDSFGEWWVEHWGHVDCVAFWRKYEEVLRQR